MGNNWKNGKRSFLERLVNAWCDLGRFVIRYLYPDMTEEERTQLDEPFYQEWLFISSTGKKKDGSSMPVGGSGNGLQVDIGLSWCSSF